MNCQCFPHRSKWKRDNSGKQQELTNRQTCRLCYFGQFGRIVDYDTLFAGIHKTLEKMPVEFVLCGNGPEFDICRETKRQSTHSSSRMVDAAKIWVLMEMGAVGEFTRIGLLRVSKGRLGIR